MSDRCLTPEYEEGQCHCVYHDGGRTRDERVESYYDGWGARDMAEYIVDMEDEARRLYSAWKSARRRAFRAMGAWRHQRWQIEAQSKEMRGQDEFARELWGWLTTRRQERDRYRSAWMSARRRATHESNMAADAVAHLAAERDRWRASHERAEAQLVQERRELERLRAEIEQIR